MNDNIQKLVILGASGHAKMIYSIAQKLGIKTLGFFDDINPDKLSYLGCRVFKNFSQLPKPQINDIRYIIGLGDNSARKKLCFKLIKHCSYAKFITLIDKSAIVSKDVKIEEGSVIMPGAIINPGTRIGKHCIVNTGAQLDHDCLVNDYSSIGPAAVCGGNVSVGFATAICIGAKIIEKINIGDNSIVGAGSVVISDIPPNVMAYGCPAKIVKSIRSSEKYLK